MTNRTLDKAQLTRFISWGALNTAISILIYAALVYAGLTIWLANLIAIIGGILLGHFFNKHMVFRSRNANTLIKYFILWSVLYLISTGLIFGFIELGSNKYLAAVFSGIVLVPISYIVQKLKIFQGQAHGN
ncbi:MAG: GtrA family protein [Hellea sp.]|nr:GtrA family protein [Hellea sp.]